MERVVNLDLAGSDQDLFLLTFEGQPVALSKSRILELLRREKAYLAQLAAQTSKGPAAPAPERPRPQFDPSEVAPGPVSHASLSSRIKKVYDYSLASRRLRAAHVNLLTEMIQSYDGRLPDHPNTKLQQHLMEMLTWRDVPDEFRALVMDFLDRYTKARNAKGR